MMKKSKKPLIIGASVESAGIGGVTIHIKRLRQWFDKRGCQYDFCDYKVSPIIEQFMLIASHKAVHIHISRPLPRLVYILYCRLVGTKSILTIHGDLGRFSGLKNMMDQWSVRLCNVPVLINARSYSKSQNWNVNSIQLSAFLPPVEDGYLPQYVPECITKARKEGKAIVASNASVMSFTDSGEEIYGITFAIDFFRHKKDYLLCVSDPSGQYLEKYKGDELENVLFIAEQHSFYRLMKLSDIMLRPTATDGDALSVKEGLYLNKKVVATDRVDRPNGVILFHYNDSESLLNALASSPTPNGGLQNEQVVDALINIYNTLNK